MNKSEVLEISKSIQDGENRKDVNILSTKLDQFFLK